nr:hypothetical protein [Tanacetum cinerariifolium]
MPSFLSPESTVSYFDDLDFLKDFDNEFPATVYNDALTSKSNSPIEPIEIPYRIDEFDLKTETSLSECNEEEQNIVYFNDLFPFNIIYPDGLESDKDNENNKIDIIHSSEDMALSPRDQRHQYLRFEGLEYTDADIADFEMRLGNIYSSETKSARKISDKGDINAYWVGISSAGYFLGTTPFYTSIRDPMLRLCHMLIECNIAGRSQAPEKRGMISGGQFIARLAKHFGLLTEERLQGLTMIVRDLPVIDMAELARRQIYEELVDTWAWVSPGLERHPDVTAGAPMDAGGALDVDEEEEVHEIRGALGEQREVMDAMARDLSRFTVWVAGGKALPVSKVGCVLSQDSLRFVSRPLAFCLNTWTDFASWQQRIRLYCQGKENEVNILKSIDEGPFQMGTVREPLAEGTEKAPYLGPERPRVYSDLLPKEKDRYNADIRATNILLQGLPKDIYTLINHYTNAKDIWDNVKMLLEGETIHDYYVWFSKLINDMRNIKMTMSKMQLNSKFVNNMLPEWGRFVTAVKLNGGLRDPNYDQLYAYLKQHETHANENKMMLDRFSQHIVDPLALMSNVSHQQHYSQSSSTPPSTYVPPHLADNTHRTNLQFKMAKLWFKMFRVDRIEVRGPIHEVEVQLGHIARNCTQPKHPQNSDYYKNKMLRMQDQENRVALDEEQLLFLAGGQDTAIYEDVDEKPVQDLAFNVDNMFQDDDYDAFKFDVDEALTAQTMFMANLSSADPVNDEAGPSYDSDILFEVQDHDHYQDTVCRHHEEHAMHNNVQLNHIVDSHANYMSDSNMILYDQYVKDNAVPVVHINVSSIPNDAYMMIYNHVPAIVHNTEDTLEIAEITRSKMNNKMKEPECVTHKVKIAPHDYSKENFLATFITHKQLTPEQIFWSQDLIKMKSEALRE